MFSGFLLAGAGGFLGGAALFVLPGPVGLCGGRRLCVGHLCGQHTGKFLDRLCQSSLAFAAASGPDFCGGRCAGRFYYIFQLFF